MEIIAVALKMKDQRGQAGDLLGATRQTQPTMLNWTFTFFILGIIAAVLDVTGVAGAAVSIAHALFALFMGLMIASLLITEQRRRHD